MTPFEMKALFVGVCVVAGIALWLALSLTWGRKRPEPRLEPVSMSQLAVDQDQLNRLREKRRRIEEEVIRPCERTVFLTSKGRAALRRAAAGPIGWTAFMVSPITGRLRRLHLWTPPFGEEFAWPVMSRTPYDAEREGWLR